MVSFLIEILCHKISKLKKNGISHVFGKWREMRIEN